MARALRLELPDGVYHVTSRGNARQAIFLSDADREAFLSTLALAVARFGLLCHAYCLMENHYHILLETPRANLARAMRFLNSSYAQSFNRRHRRVGHLLQGRYHAVLVERESHLLELARYVVLNPVRVGLCGRAGDWPWSSYRAAVGLDPAPPFLTVGWVLGQFAETRATAVERYRAFVEDEAGSSPWGHLRGHVFLGGEDFVARHSSSLPRLAEVPRSQREPLRPSLSTLFSTHGEAAILLAYRCHGYRLVDLAEHMGVHYATVSRRLRRLEDGNSLPPRRRR